MATGTVKTPINTSVTYSSITVSSNVTGSVRMVKSGHSYGALVDITLSAVGSGWSEIATLPVAPLTNYYGVVSTTTGTCKLAIVTSTGKVQILGAGANVEYIGTLTYFV